MTSEKGNYQVKSGIAQIGKQSRAYWEMQFEMPASVVRISVSGISEADKREIKLKFLGQDRNVIKVFKQTPTKNCNVKGVYYIRIEKSADGPLTLADVKVYGTQGKNACS